jgi:hypothetical protein
MKSFLGSFDNTQVALLQMTFDGACKELGVARSDETSRMKIAKDMIALATAGQLNPDRLRLYVISRFKALERT